MAQMRKIGGISFQCDADDIPGEVLGLIVLAREDDSDMVAIYPEQKAGVELMEVAVRTRDLLNDAINIEITPQGKVS